jgi:cystathionine beta-lyase
LVVDNTFASPVSQKPLNLGADIVVHSATKYLAGHSDLVGGTVVTKSNEPFERIRFIQNASGAVPGPWDCFLTIRGIETLALRHARQCASALEIANLLEQSPEVDKVYYPGLTSHINHEIAARQQRGAFGGVVSFTLHDDTVDAAEQFVTSTKLFHLAESLGGVKSLVCHPAQMTHASIPRDRRLSSGIADSLVRLSCGIEETDDLLEDISEALAITTSQSKYHAAL